MVEQLEQIAQELSLPDDENLKTISNLCLQQACLEDEVSQLEEELKNKKAELRKLTEDAIPAAMEEHGVSKLSLVDGSEISITKFYSARIPSDRQEEAFAWLTEEGHGSLIKNHVTAAFGRGQHNEALSLISELDERGMTVSKRIWVEPMTLKSFVKEQIEKGENIPHDLFGVFLGKRAKLKRR